MRLVVTRPIADAQVLAEKLASLGHDAMVAPLFTVRPRSPLIIPDRVHVAVAFTSANAVKAAAADAALERLKAIRAYAVGPQSADEARRAGFTDVAQGGGDARSLIAAIAARETVDGGPVLYLSGDTISVDVAGALETSGFAVDRVVAYDTQAVEALPAEVDRAIRAGAVDGVLLYSARAAEAWVKCVAESGLEPYMKAIVHYCLSAAIAARLPEGVRRRSAERPEEASMFALLATRAGESR